ncbi:hypothetical protein GGI20_006352, partial [Coemansia sp. BCRC 34301]
NRQRIKEVVVGSSQGRVLLRPLLWACNGLRAVARLRYCSLLKLELACSPSYLLANRPAELTLLDVGFRPSNCLGHATHHLAKCLIAELDERAIYSGQALMMLSQPPFSGCAFQLARSITFIVFLDKPAERNGSYDLVDDSTPESQRMQASAAAFVQRAKQMAPRISKVE